MAGNTGKMTTEALLARGPRMRLCAVYDGYKRLGFVVYRDPDSPIGLGITKLKHPAYRTYAHSYSLGYLLRVGKAQIQLEDMMRREMPRTA